MTTARAKAQENLLDAGFDCYSALRDWVLPNVEGLPAEVRTEVKEAIKYFMQRKDELSVITRSENRRRAALAAEVTP